MGRFRTSRLQHAVGHHSSIAKDDTVDAAGLDTATTELRLEKFGVETTDSQEFLMGAGLYVLTGQERR